MKKLVICLLSVVLAGGIIEGSEGKVKENGRAKGLEGRKQERKAKTGTSQKNQGAAPVQDAPSPLKKLGGAAYQFGAAALSPFSPLKDAAEILVTQEKDAARKAAVERWFKLVLTSEALEAFIEEQKSANIFWNTRELVNAVDKDDETLLDKAAYQGRREAVFTLYGHDANPNRKYEDGDTLLHRLVKTAAIAIDMVTCLIECQADPNAKDSQGNTVLQILVQRDDVLHLPIDLFNELFKCGADPKKTDSDGNNLLHLLATKKGLTREHGLYKLLLGKDIDPQDQNVFNETVEDIMKFLAGGSSVEEGAGGAAEENDTTSDDEEPSTPPRSRPAIDDGGGIWANLNSIASATKKVVVDVVTASSPAALADRTEALNQWWALSLTNDEAGANALQGFVERQKSSGAYRSDSHLKSALVNDVDSNGDTMLLRAFKDYGKDIHPQLLACFEDIGADFGKTDGVGDSIFHMLYKGLNKNDQRFIEKLIALGVRPEVSNNDRETILHLLAHRQGADKLDQEMVAWWVGKGVRPTQRDNNGDTLLHLLARQVMPQDIGFFKYLIETVQINPLVINNDQETFLHILAGKGLKKADLEKLEQVPEWKLVLPKLTQSKETVLHLLALQNGFDREIITWWQRHKISHLLQQDDEGNTFLHVLAKKGVQDCDLYKMVATGEGVDLGMLTNNDGDTVLHLLARKGLKKDNPLYTLLVKEGKIDPAQKNGAGKSVLDLIQATVVTPPPPPGNPGNPRGQQPPQGNQGQHLEAVKRTPLLTAWNLIITLAVTSAVYMLYKKYGKGSQEPSLEATMQQS